MGQLDQRRLAVSVWQRVARGGLTARPPIGSGPACVGWTGKDWHRQIFTTENSARSTGTREDYGKRWISADWISWPHLCNWTRAVILATQRAGRGETC